MRKYQYAIEMGGGYTSIYVNGQGLALKEPTLVAAEPTADGYKVIALGLDAKKIIGKTKENVEIFTPMPYMDHSNYEYSVVLLKHFLKKVDFRFDENAIFIIPCGLSATEKQNILKVCEGADLGHVELVPAPICACVGGGRNVDNSKVDMVVDIGGTSTEIAVINMSNILKGATLGIGGKSIDASIVNFLAYTQNLVVGISTAETLKKEVGSLYTNDTLNMEITGVDTHTKTPRTAVIFSNELRQAIEPFYAEIVRSIDATINALPPEIVADIINSKILIVGGGAKMQGLDNYLKKNLNYPVEICEDCENATILGAGKLIADSSLLQGILNNL